MMTVKELKQLGRIELLELLLEESKENEQLARRVSELEARVQDRTIKMTQAGSIAEAALSLNGVFEAAQASCQQYVENLARMNEQQEQLSRELNQQARAEAVRIIEEAQERCSSLEQEAQERCTAMEQTARDNCSRMEQEAQERCSLLEQETKNRCTALEEETGRQSEVRLAEADRQIKEKWAQISGTLSTLYASQQGLMELLSHGMSLGPEKGIEDAQEKTAE